MQQGVVVLEEETEAVKKHPSEAVDQEELDYLKRFGEGYCPGCEKGKNCATLTAFHAWQAELPDSQDAIVERPEGVPASDPE